MPHKTKIKITPEEMVNLRREGATLEEIASRAGVCPTRAGQIVRRLAPGIRKQMAKRNRSKEFTGADIDIAVKDALREYLRNFGGSISTFVAEAVEEKLKLLGVEIHRVPMNRGEPLPFDKGEV
jgi:hypothetical protein